MAPFRRLRPVANTVPACLSTLFPDTINERRRPDYHSDAVHCTPPFTTCCAPRTSIHTHGIIGTRRNEFLSSPPSRRWTCTRAGTTAFPFRTSASSSCHTSGTMSLPITSPSHSVSFYVDGVKRSLAAHCIRAGIEDLIVVLVRNAPTFRDSLPSFCQRRRRSLDPAALPPCYRPTIPRRFCPGCLAAKQSVGADRCCVRRHGRYDPRHSCQWDYTNKASHCRFPRNRFHSVGTPLDCRLELLVHA